MEQCKTCWKAFELSDTCIYNGVITCNKCAAKFIKHCFGRDK